MTVTKILLLVVSLIFAIPSFAEEITLSTIMPRQDIVSGRSGVIGDSNNANCPWLWRALRTNLPDNMLFVGETLLSGDTIGIGASTAFVGTPYRLTVVSGAGNNGDCPVGLIAPPPGSPASASPSAGIAMLLGENFATNARNVMIGLAGVDAAWTNNSLRGDFVQAVYGGNIRFATASTAGNTANDCTTKMLIQNNGSVYVTGSFSANTVVDRSATSDIRFKKDVAPISGALDKIVKIRGVSFKWDREKFKDMNFSEGRQLGVIAQEIDKVFPEIVAKDSKGYMSVSYDKLVPVLIEAVKEQQKEIDTLKKELNTIKGNTDARCKGEHKSQVN